MTTASTTPFVTAKALECAFWHGGVTVARDIPSQLIEPMRRATDSNWRSYPASALYTALGGV